MKRYVVTGAPGAGKTAIIRHLEIEGFSVVEESATDVIALRQAEGLTEPWTRPEFIDAIVHLQEMRERRSRNATEPFQFHDRSVICTAALADYLKFPRSQRLLDEIARIQAESVFEKQVLFLRNLGFVAPTEARRITYDDTVRFEQIHERVYREAGLEIIHIEPGPVSERVRQIKRALSLEHA
jgi:predicted ATPase